MRLFYSYCHADEGFRDDMEKHLSVLKRNGDITGWSDREILPGQDFEKEIEQELLSADIIALLISSDFLNSPACTDEMKKALDLRQKCGTIVVPIILRPCGWGKSEIASLLALPKDGVPVDRWQSRDEAFLDIVNGISNIVEAASTRLRQGYLDEITRIEFISQNKNSIRIDDLFVFPHIVWMRDESDTPIDDLEGMLNVGNHIILRGADRSGKTTICRKLFIDKADQDVPIVMISGNELTSSLRHEELVSRKYVEQFTGSFDRWKRMQNKILIIDDFGPRSHVGFIVFAKEFFHSVVVTLSDDDYLSFFRDEKEFANFSVLSIYPMKHTQQEDLIRKWKSLSGEDHGDSGVSDGTIDQLENRLNGIILHNKIVPRFPFFVLSILQTYEAFMPQGLQISAYGHCYQALITAQMIRGGIRGDDIDSAFNFLGHVAFHLFLTRRERESRSFDEFAKEYKSRFVILPNVFNRLVDPAGGLLRRNGIDCDFQYPFVYYYFLGYYFGTHQDECNEYIEKLVEKSYRRDNAYILIFSIHHTHDGLIGRILEHTMSAFREAGVAHMHTAEMKVLETALFEVPKDVLSGRAVESERKVERERRDKAELSNTDYAENGDENLNDVYRMLKNMEILGQIIRNKYGSLTKERIENIMTTIVDAGLRLVHIITSSDSIRGFDDFIAERANELRSKASEKMRDRHSHRVEPDVLEELRKQFRALVVMTVYMILKKTAITIGKAELDDVVREVVRKRATPAYELVGAIFELGTAGIMDTRLVGRIISTLRRRKKERNWVVRRLISLETQIYLNTHAVKHDLRRKLFQELGLEYRPNLVSSERKLSQSGPG